MTYRRLSALVVAFAVLSVNPLQAGRENSPLPKAFTKVVPESIQDLVEIQEHVKKLVERVLPSTVAINIGKVQGSGVIVTKDGFVLTAGHVTAQADQDVELILHDGRRIRGRTLGIHNSTDCGLLKITESGDWPHVEMGQAEDLYRGKWCLALGHPLGYHQGRPPVVRLGRILEKHKLYLRSDCTLVGGDSGGPLFDMHGKVVGIHSRIGNLLSANIHVPVDIYKENWDRLAKGEVWGDNLFGKKEGAYLGLRVDGSARVTLVAPDSPAAKAGIHAGDVILRLGERTISRDADLEEALTLQKIGTPLTLQVRRDSDTLTLKVVLTEKPRL